jgi:hypothetical protein
MNAIHIFPPRSPKTHSNIILPVWTTPDSQNLQFVSNQSGRCKIIVREQFKNMTVVKLRNAYIILVGQPEGILRK